MAKILVVDDDKDLAWLLTSALEDARFTVEQAHDGDAGLHLLKVSHFDLLILDWQMPNASGIDLIRAYRNAGGKAPILMLTGQTSFAHKEEGFGIGADDYMTKPFDVRELLLRVNALLRRAASNSVANSLKVGNLTLDPTLHVVHKGVDELRLAPREFKLLEFFMRHPGETFSVESLLDRVYASDDQASNEGLRMAIMRLREAVDDAGVGTANSLIQNIPRVGYRLRIQ